MTRINVIPPEQLHDKHLVAEYRELPRVIKLARKLSDKEKVENYTMGKGHVKFFYDKILYLKKRQDSLISEMIKRGFKPNFTDTSHFLKVDSSLLNDWSPSETDVITNVTRINERLEEMKK